MSEHLFTRFSGDCEPVSPKMWRRADPDMLELLYTRRFDEIKNLPPKSDEEIEARKAHDYTPEEYDTLLTDERRQMLQSMGEVGIQLLNRFDHMVATGEDLVSTQ